MSSTTTSEVPILLIDYDGYEIETVLVGPHAKYTAWILLAVRPSGRVGPVASGWTSGHENARSEAYSAYLEHKRQTLITASPMKENP